MTKEKAISLLGDIKDKEVHITIGGIISIILICVMSVVGYMDITKQIDNLADKTTKLQKDFSDLKEAGPRAQPQIDLIVKENLERDKRIQTLEDKWERNYVLLVQIATKLGIKDLK